jgi:hypothetical protein
VVPTVSHHGFALLEQLCGRPALRRCLGLTKQDAWLLWHGKIALRADLMRRLHGELGISLDALIQVGRATPAKRRGRPPLRSRPKRRPS